jgi:hypothetical protein
MRENHPARVGGVSADTVQAAAVIARRRAYFAALRCL